MFATTPCNWFWTEDLVQLKVQEDPNISWFPFVHLIVMFICDMLVI